MSIISILINVISIYVHRVWTSIVNFRKSGLASLELSILSVFRKVMCIIDAESSKMVLPLRPIKILVLRWIMANVACFQQSLDLCSNIIKCSAPLPFSDLSTWSGHSIYCHVHQGNYFLLIWFLYYDLDLGNVQVNNQMLTQGFRLYASKEC